MALVYRIRWFFVLLAFAVLVAGCSSDGTIQTKRIPVPEGADGAGTHDMPGRPGSAQGRGSVLGEGGLFGLGGDGNSAGSGGGGIGVNSFLWRATLDTISFMPVTSADPFGGVIITDWRASADSPDERFKMNIYLLGRQLRADGVRVAIFRQVLQNNIWRDAELPSGTERKIEDSILTRARQLRNAAVTQE